MFGALIRLDLARMEGERGVEGGTRCGRGDTGRMNAAQSSHLGGHRGAHGKSEFLLRSQKACTNRTSRCASALFDIVIGSGEDWV
jgi:hypothetical protein